MAFWSKKKTEAAEAANGHSVIVAPHAGKWQVLIPGAFETQGAAILIGRYIASSLDLELQIHGEDGKIRAKDSSGNAPDDPHIPG